MGIGRKSIEIVLGFGLAAAQMFGAKTPDIEKHISKSSVTHSTTPTKKIAKKLGAITPLDPETEPHYAVVVGKDGVMQPLPQLSPFDPDTFYTAASHTKLSTILAAFDVMKENPELQTPENWERARRSLIRSSNKDAEELACIVAFYDANQMPQCGKNTSTQTRLFSATMLQERINFWKLPGPLVIANGSGRPDWGRDKWGKQDEATREDSISTPRATLAVAIQLTQRHLDWLEEIDGSIVQADHPTNNLFLLVKDIVRGSTFMWTKTETDDDHVRSTVTIIATPDKIYGIFHPHDRDDPHPSVASSARVIERVLIHVGLDLPPLFDRLRKIGSGTLESHTIGKVLVEADRPVQASGGLHRAHRSKRPVHS